MFARVDGQPDLVRTEDGVIQNINQDEYQAYVARRRAVMESRGRIDNLEREVGEIKNNIALILQLLQDRKQ